MEAKLDALMEATKEQTAHVNANIALLTNQHNVLDRDTTQHFAAVDSKLENLGWNVASLYGALDGVASVYVYMDRVMLFPSDQAQLTESDVCDQLEQAAKPAVLRFGAVRKIRVRSGHAYMLGFVPVARPLVFSAFAKLRTANSTWQLRDCLTDEGKRVKEERQPHYRWLRERGMGPSWRNGADLFVRQAEGERPVPYQPRVHGEPARPTAAAAEEEDELPPTPAHHGADSNGDAVMGDRTPEPRDAGATGPAPGAGAGASTSTGDARVRSANGTSTSGRLQQASYPNPLYNSNASNANYGRGSTRGPSGDGPPGGRGAPQGPKLAPFRAGAALSTPARAAPGTVRPPGGPQ